MVPTNLLHLAGSSTLSETRRPAPELPQPPHTTSEPLHVAPELPQPPHATSEPLHVVPEPPLQLATPDFLRVTPEGPPLAASEPVREIPDRPLQLATSEPVREAPEPPPPLATSEPVRVVPEPVRVVHETPPLATFEPVRVVPETPPPLAASGPVSEVPETPLDAQPNGFVDPRRLDPNSCLSLAMQKRLSTEVCDILALFICCKIYMNRTITISFIGPVSTGKTMTRVVSTDPQADPLADYTATLGCDLSLARAVPVPGRGRFDVKVFDCSGGNTYGMRSVFRTTQAFCVFFALDEEQSLTEALRILSTTMADNPWLDTSSVVVVGNKSDLARAYPPASEMERLVKQRWRMVFVREHKAATTVPEDFSYVESSRTLLHDGLRRGVIAEACSAAFRCHHKLKCQEKACSCAKFPPLPLDLAATPAQQTGCCG